MKKYILIIAVLALSSCKQEYLNLDPINSYTYYNFPKNEDQINQAVVATYASARGLHNGNLWVFGEFMSDNTSFRFNPSDRGGLNTESIDEMIVTSDNGAILNFWSDSYDGIMRSNYVLESIETIPFRVETTKSTRIGEVRFWRAWQYFNIVRLYGDVPIITKVITNPTEGTTYNREAANKVYDTMILPDALDAVAKLPATADPGRLTKGAALMLLAKIYMTQKKFAEAATQLNELLKLGYVLNANYADNFDPLKKNSKESILEMQSDAAQNSMFGFGPSWTPWGTGITIWPGNSNSRGGLNQPTADLNAAYEANDTRKAVTIGSASGVLYLKKFIVWDAATKLNPVNFPTYRYADALLMLAECLNEQSYGNAQAFALLNQVRKRAGLPDKTAANTVPALAVPTQQAFRLTIEKERQVELAGENHRWFDLVRTDRAVEVMTAHGISEKKVKTTVQPTAYTKIRTLLAIPQREARQWGYAQNPDW